MHTLIKTCPFCGSMQLILETQHDRCEDEEVNMYLKTYYALICKSCQAASPLCETLDELISKWDGVATVKRGGISNIDGFDEEFENDDDIVEKYTNDGTQLLDETN